MNELADSQPPESVGRYLLYPAIASGGMATVHTARLVGAEGFTRLVAAKRLHPQFLDDPDFVTMFHDEACIASRIHHPNVVPVLDVVLSGQELILVQEYVHGVPLSQLMKVAQVGDAAIAIDIAIAVLTGILAGLHGAHEVRDEDGHPLEIVHRDVSPANVMISIDGVPRLLDFGIAKARTSTHHTREGVFKGKLAYMAPEQFRMDAIDRTVDVYATGVLAWELLVNRRVYDGRHELAFVTAVMNGEIPSVTAALAARREDIDDARWSELEALDAIVARAMARGSAERFATAEDMMRALLEVRPSATSMTVAAWVRDAGAEFLDKRQKTLAANEESWRRMALRTPSSGLQRVNHGSFAAALPGVPSSAPSSLPGGLTTGTMPSGAMTTGAMSSGTMSSGTPPAESGAFRLALRATPLAIFGARVRTSRALGPRYLPWLAAGAFVIAGLAGGLLRSASDPQAVTASEPGEALTLPVLPLAPSTGPGAELPPASAPATPTPTLSPPAPLSAPPAPPPPPQAFLWRPIHVSPPPPAPPRAAPPARPAPPSPASAPNGATAPPFAAARVDCTPPFFYEGTKKVFKPSCL